MTFVQTFPPSIFETIGMAGFFLYVMNYTLLTLQKLRSEQLTFFVLNWCAATCVLIGLTTSFNLASALIQIFWIVISTIGILIRLRQSSQRNTSFTTARGKPFTATVSSSKRRRDPFHRREPVRI